MKKYQVMLSVVMIEKIYNIEANNVEEAGKKALEKSEYRGEAQLEIFEIEIQKD